MVQNEDKVAMCKVLIVFFCMSYHEITTRSKDLLIAGEKENEDSGRNSLSIIYGKSCFHKAHEEGIRQALLKQEM